MSLMYCEHCDALLDTDTDVECACELEDDVEVAPGIYQSKEDYEANVAVDAARGN